MKRFSPSMDHLACFLPGLLALGHSAGADPDGIQGHLELAKRLAHTCYNFYNQSKSGMAPETVVFDMSMEDNDKVAAVSLHTRATCHHEEQHVRRRGDEPSRASSRASSFAALRGESDHAVARVLAGDT